MDECPKSLEGLIDGSGCGACKGCFNHLLEMFNEEVNIEGAFNSLSDTILNKYKDRLKPDYQVPYARENYL